MAMIEGDIRKKQPKSVIINSPVLLGNLVKLDNAYPLDTFDVTMVTFMLEALWKLKRYKYVVFVAPGGSEPADLHDPNRPDAPHNAQSQFPGLYAYTGYLNKFIIPVGGVDMDRWQNQYRMHRNMEAWAPAISVATAAIPESFLPNEITPTRIAAAAAAGLLAYFVGLGFNVQESRILLYGFGVPLAGVSAEDQSPTILNIINNNAWGVCQDAAPPQGPLTWSYTKKSENRVKFIREAKARIKRRRIAAGIDLNFDGLFPDARTVTKRSTANDTAGEPPEEDELACPRRSTSSSSSSSGESTSFTSTSYTSSEAASTSFTTSHTQTTTITTGTDTATPTEEMSSEITVSSLEISTQPSEDEPTPVEEEPEPVETITIEDEPIVGELATLGDDILVYVLPPLAAGAGLVALLIPLLNGKTSTTHVSVSAYASQTITFDKAHVSNFNITIPKTATSSRPKSVSASTTTKEPTSTTFATATGSSMNTVTSRQKDRKTSSLSSSTDTGLPPIGTGDPGRDPIDRPSPDDLQLAEKPVDRQFCHGLYKAERNTTVARWIQYLPNNWYYVHRDTMAKLINDEVCEEIHQDSNTNKPGHVAKTFFRGSPEMVDFYYAWHETPPYKDECKEHFLSILDGCDGNDPSNPYNWKGGGERIIGDNLYFKIEPRWPFRRLPGRIFAACWFRTNSKEGEAIATIWGYGWNDAFDDWTDGVPGRRSRGPEEFFNQINGCRWDGRWHYTAATPEPKDLAKWEWKLQIGFQTNWIVDPRARLSQRCVEDAVKKFSGISDFSCGDEDWEAPK
ncbi:hypothetical protein TWF696_008018 [Orbilia brochopaga]|uniref:Uncharacterized protein n=1 Tax=Orbilia brochopaga TaxID=3140254 RepID=A0AAV9ULU1_9PEZI